MLFFLPLPPFYPPTSSTRLLFFSLSPSRFCYLLPNPISLLSLPSLFLPYVPFHINLSPTSYLFVSNFFLPSSPSSLSSPLPLSFPPFSSFQALFADCLASLGNKHVKGHKPRGRSGLADVCLIIHGYFYPLLLVMESGAYNNANYLSRSLSLFLSLTRSVFSHSHSFFLPLSICSLHTPASLVFFIKPSIVTVLFLCGGGRLVSPFCFAFCLCLCVCMHRLD